MKQIQADAQALWHKYTNTRTYNSNKRDYTTMAESCTLCCCNCNDNKDCQNGLYHENFKCSPYKPCQQCFFNKPNIYNNDSLDKSSQSSFKYPSKMDCVQYGANMHHQDPKPIVPNNQRRNQFCKKPINDR